MGRKVADVVNAEHMVIDRTLHQVEQAPSKDEQSGEAPGTGKGSTPAAVRQKPVHAYQGGQPNPGMEQSILGHILLHGLHGGWRQHGGSHIVPLDDLVQHNTIYKSAETHAQEDAGTLGSVQRRGAISGLFERNDQQERGLAGRFAVTRITSLDPHIKKPGPKPRLESASKEWF